MGQQVHPGISRTTPDCTQGVAATLQMLANPPSCDNDYAGRPNRLKPPDYWGCDLLGGFRAAQHDFIEFDDEP
jgi:hypothetical protein